MAGEAGHENMRLICPSCGAQYEVDESVIPEGGRDVQCSSCGHAWFQRSAAQLKAEEEHKADLSRQAQAEEIEPQPAAEDALEPEPPQEPTPEPRAEPEPEEITAESDLAEPLAEEEADTAPELDAEPDEEASDESELAGEEIRHDAEPSDVEATEDDRDDEEDEDEFVAPAPQLARREMDDSVRDVLREEAEREVRARVSEGQPVETQVELGLAAGAGKAVDAGISTEEAVRDRVARLRGDEDDLDEEALVSRASRRELLPDIEEINSTLRATSDRGDEAASIDAPETLRRRRSGFRMGFSTALFVALIALVVYLLAPTLSGMVPALEPALSGYVATVDSGRIWLDNTMKSLTASLNGDA